MRFTALTLVIVSIIVCGPQVHTYAHVLLREDSGKLSAVLHINPDDDPIAGRVADVFFDLEGRDIRPIDTPVTISVQKPDGSIDVIQRQLDANGDVGLKYTFMVKGTYALRLELSGQDGTPFTLSHTQYVERGQAANSSTLQHPFAELLLVISISAFAILAILGVVNKREIIDRSVM